MARESSPPKEALHLPKVVTRTVRLQEDRSLPDLGDWNGIYGQNAIRERKSTDPRARTSSQEGARQRESSHQKLPEVHSQESRVRNTRTPPLITRELIRKQQQNLVRVAEPLLNSPQDALFGALLSKQENVRPSSRGVVFLRPIDGAKPPPEEREWLSSPRQVLTPREPRKGRTPLTSSLSDDDVVLTHSVSSSLNGLSPRSFAKVRGSLEGPHLPPGAAPSSFSLIGMPDYREVCEEGVNRASASWRTETEYFAVGGAQLKLEHEGTHSPLQQATSSGSQISSSTLATAEGFALPPGKRKAGWSAEMLSSIPRTKTPITISESAATAASLLLRHELEGTLQPPNSPVAAPKLPYSFSTREVESAPSSPQAQSHLEPVSNKAPSQYKNLPKEVRSGEDAVKYFSARNSESSIGPQLLFLDYASRREVGGFDPYDLQVVPPSMAGSEHFTMSALGVVHLIEGQTSESVPLSLWVHRRHVYGLLKKMTFFGKFALVKAFAAWRSFGRRERFAAARAFVHERLLVCGSDKFRTALLRVKAEATRISDIPIGSLLSRFGPPPYHERHFNSLRDSECAAAAAAMEGVAARVLYEVESCCKGVIRDVITANAPEQSPENRLKRFELPDKSWKVESASYQKQQKAEHERARGRALWHHNSLVTFVRCADAVVLGEIVQVARAQCARYLEVLATSRPRGLLHLNGSMEEVFRPEVLNPLIPAPESGGGVSLGLRVLDHEVFGSEMEVDKIRETEVSQQQSPNGSTRASEDKQALSERQKFPLSANQTPLGDPKGTQSGPSTCLVFEPSFDNVTLMLEGTLHGIVRALTSGYVRLLLAKELQAVVGHVDRSGLPHAKAIVSEAVNLEGLVQQLREDIQRHVHSVMASDAVVPFATTGPLCDLAARWTAESYMATAPSPQDFCRDARLMQSWLVAVQKAKTSFATDLLIVDTQKAKAKLLPLAAATLHGLAVLMGDELKRKVETCKEGMQAAIKLLRSMPVELESFLKFVETVQPHFAKGDYVRQAAADIEAIAAMKDLLAQIPDSAASRSGQVAAAFRALKEIHEDYLAAGDMTRAHIRKQAETVHVALEKTSTQLCEQLRQELLSLRVGSFVAADEPPARARDLIVQKLRRLDALRASADLCMKQQALMGYEADRRIQHFLSACEEVLRRKETLWDALLEWTNFLRTAEETPLAKVGESLDVQRVTGAIGKMNEQLGAILVLKTDSDQLKSGTNTVAEEKFARQLQSRLATWQGVLPVLIRLCNGHLRPQHLALFQRALGLSGEVSVTALLDCSARALVAAADAAFARARQESNLFDRLQKLKLEWQSVYLEVKASVKGEASENEGHVTWPVLSGMHELLQRFADSQAELAQIMSSPFAGGLSEEIEEWDDVLAGLRARVEDAADCQDLLDFFGRIFADEDVRKAMFADHQLFVSLSNQWAAMMTSVQIRSHLIAAAQPTSPLAKCAALRDRLSEIQGDFSDHLDTLRAGFPRLYFLSDSELLALAAARDFALVNHLVTKCFPGIASLVFQTRLRGPGDDEPGTLEHKTVVAVKSNRGEVVTLNRVSGLVRLPARVDRWMSRLLEALKKTLAVQTRDVLAGKAINPPLQSLLLADAITWTADVDHALATSHSKAALRALSGGLSRKQGGDQKGLESCRSVAVKFRQQVLQRLIAAPLDELHGEWKKELRYTWHKESESCTVQMGEFTLPYGFHSYADVLSSPLPHVPASPETLSTFGAISTGQFVALKVPEQGGVNTFEALAHACGRPFVACACTEALDYRSMARLLTGAAGSEAWLYLSNARALALAVASVLAQQLNVLKQGLAARAQLVSLEGVDISLQPGFSFALSLPPGGRSEHPQLRTLIDWTCHNVEAEAVDISKGSEQRDCDEKERELLRAALLELISSKSLPFDANLLVSKCLDLHASMKGSTAIFITGASQSGKTACWRLLAEAISLLVGKVGTAEGPVNVNRGLEEAVNTRIIYPGALTQEELLGGYGPKHQWENGLLPTLCSDLCGRNGHQNWVVLDGDLSGPHWALLEPLVAAEAPLCLPNGLTFKIPDNALLIFETTGVSALTPASLGSARVISVPLEMVLPAKVVSKWVGELPTEVLFLKSFLTQLVDKAEPLWRESFALEPGLCPTAGNAESFVGLLGQLLGQDPVTIAARKICGDRLGPSSSEVGTGHILSRSLSLERIPRTSTEQAEENQLTENAEQAALLYFVFTLFWALGGGKCDRLEKRVREIFGGQILLPESTPLYEMQVNSERRGFVPWLVSSPVSLTHPDTGSQMYIPTPQSESVRNLLKLAALGGLTPLLKGPPSSRKSFIMQLAAKDLAESSDFTSTTALLTRGTSAESLAHAIRSRLVPGAKKGALRTPLGKRLLLVVDDLHIPLEGTQSEDSASGSLELLRQLGETNTMYNSSDGQSVEINGLSLALVGEESSNKRLEGRAFTLEVREEPSHSTCHSILESLVKDPLTNAELWPSASKTALAAADALMTVRSLIGRLSETDLSPANRSHVRAARRILGLGGFVSALAALHRLHTAHIPRKHEGHVAENEKCKGVTPLQNEARLSDTDMSKFTSILKNAQREADARGRFGERLEGFGLALLRSALQERVGVMLDEGFAALLDVAIAKAVENSGENLEVLKPLPLSNEAAKRLEENTSAKPSERLVWRASLQWALQDESSRSVHVADKKVRLENKRVEETEGIVSDPLTFPDAEIHFAKLVDALSEGANVALVGPPCSRKGRIARAALKLLGLEGVNMNRSCQSALSGEAEEANSPLQNAGKSSPGKVVLLDNNDGLDPGVLEWLSGVSSGATNPADAFGAQEKESRAKNQQRSGNKISKQAHPAPKTPSCRFILLCEDATWQDLINGFPELRKRLRVVRINPPLDLAVMEFADRGLGRVWDAEPDAPLRQRANWDFAAERKSYLQRQSALNAQGRARPAEACQNPSDFGSWVPSAAAAAVHAVYARVCVAGLEVAGLRGFVQLTGELWRGAKKALRRKRASLEACLDRLDALRTGLVTSNEDAEGLQPALEALLAQSTALLAEIAVKQKGVDRERAELAKSDRELQIKLREIEALTSASQTELKRTAEVYEDALSEISHLARDDMIELKSFQTPPPLVKTVMEAVCILMGSSPDWESARRLLADSDARARLAGLDKDRVSDKTIKAVQKYVNHPSFTPSAVEQVSKACCSLCMWVLAVNEYARARASVKERGRRLAAVQRKVDEEAMALQARRNALQADESDMGRLKRKYVEVMGMQTEVEARLADVYQQGDQSSLLLRHLAGRRPIWERQLASARERLENLPGDAIMAAAVASFLGELTPAERSKSLADWGKACTEVGVSTTVNFGLASWLDAVAPAKSAVRYVAQGQVAEVREKLFIALYARGRPLIVDPDDNFERLGGPAAFDFAFLSAKAAPRVRRKRVRAAASGALQKVREALEGGSKVCLQIDGPQGDTWPDLTVAAKACASIDLQRSESDYEANKKLEDLSEQMIPKSEGDGLHDLFLYTRVRARSLPADVRTLYNVVDFSQSEDGLLSAVAEHVIPDVQAKWTALRSSISTMRQSLQVFEEMIVSEFGRPADAKDTLTLLEDEALMAAIEEKASESAALTLRIEEAILSLDEVELSRKVYQLLSNRAFLVFEAARELARAAEAHFVSWDAFKALVHRAVGFAAAVESGTVSRGGDETAENLTPQNLKSGNKFAYLPTSLEQLTIFQQNREPLSKPEAMAERLGVSLIQQLSIRLTKDEAALLRGTVAARLLVADGLAAPAEWQWVAERTRARFSVERALLQEQLNLKAQRAGISFAEELCLGVTALQSEQNDPKSKDLDGPEDSTKKDGRLRLHPEPLQARRLAELREAFPAHGSPFATALANLDSILESLGDSLRNKTKESQLESKKLPSNSKLEEFSTFTEYLSAASSEPALGGLRILQHVALFQALNREAGESALIWLSENLLEASTGLQPALRNLEARSSQEERLKERTLELLRQTLSEEPADAPLIVVRASAGSAVINGVKQLAELEGLPSHVLEVVCLGQNHGAEAEEAIHTAQRSGGWVCILGLETEADWSTRLCELAEEITSGKSYTHPLFKIWVHYHVQAGSYEDVRRLGWCPRPLPEGFLTGNLCKVVCID